MGIRSFISTKSITIHHLCLGETILSDEKTKEEEPKFVRYTKIWVDAEKDISGLLEGMKEGSIKRLKKLPSEELPFAEPRIRMLYYEAHYLTALGLFNASIVISCILLEALLKEILFFRDKDIKDRTFGSAIDECQKRGYITNAEAKWLKSVKSNIRNWYIHSNLEKIGKDIGFKAFAINLETRKIEETVLFGENVRAVYDIAKNQLDKRMAIPFFLDVDKFTREICTRHFQIESRKKWGGSNGEPSKSP